MGIGLGLDVGGTKILACAVAENGDVLAEARISSAGDRAAFMDSMESVVVDAMTELDGAVVTGLGLGLPGLVDAYGVLRGSPNLLAVQGMGFRDELVPRLVSVLARYGSDPTTLGTAIDNDGTCAAAAEHAFGVAASMQDVVLVALGTGIGGGIVTNGHVVRGYRGFAGEVGHMTVMVNGPDCPCGSFGCWELFASGSGLTRIGTLAVATGSARRIAELADGATVTGEHIFQAASEGDEAAMSIVEDFAASVSVGLGNIGELLDPQAIVLGGGLMDVARQFLPQTLAAYAKTRRGSGEHEIPLLEATLGNRAGAIGAAVLGVDTAK